MVGSIHQFLSAVAQLDVRAAREALERQPACVKARDGRGRGALQILWSVNAEHLDMSDKVALACTWDIERALRDAGLSIQGQTIEEDPFLRRLLSREVYAVADGRQDVTQAMGHLTAWWDHALAQGWPIEAWAQEVVFQMESDVSAYVGESVLDEPLAQAAELLLDRGAPASLFDGIFEMAQNGDTDFEPLAQRVRAHARARDALATPVQGRTKPRVRP